MKFSILGLLFAIPLIFVSSSVQAETRPGCITGTYLVVEGSGTQSLWTFSKDGTIQIASSAQGALNFSDGHGAWKETRSRQSKVVILDFNFASSTPPSAVARVDAAISFSKKCTTAEGSFQLRFFDPATEDPLDPETDTGDPISDTFTARKVTAK